jgi:hypothetical protein
MLCKEKKTKAAGLKKETRILVATKGLSRSLQNDSATASL